MSYQSLTIGDLICIMNVYFGILKTQSEKSLIGKGSLNSCSEKGPKAERSPKIQVTSPIRAEPRDFGSKPDGGSRYLTRVVHVVVYE